MQTLKRFFWHAIYLFLPRRSRLARVVKTRGFKRQVRQRKIYRWTRHFNAVISNFDSHTELLLLGSSHVVFGINPTVFQSLRGWNAAVHSGDYRTAYYLYMYLRKAWVKEPGQKVLVGEDFWAPFFQLEWAPPYYLCCILHCLINMPYRTTLLMKTCERAVQYVMEYWRSRVRPVRNVATYRGYAIYRREDWSDSITAAERVRKHLKFLDFKPTELRWLERLVAAIREDGREVIFLRFPFRADYREALPQQGLFSLFEGVEQYGRVIDAQSLDLPSGYWADADHLNHKGAGEFSCWLEQQIQLLS